MTADILTPQSAIPPSPSLSSSPINLPDIPTQTKPDEVLFNIDEQDLPANGPLTRILDDLNDLRFEENAVDANETGTPGE